MSTTRYSSTRFLVAAILIVSTVTGNLVLSAEPATAQACSDPVKPIKREKKAAKPTADWTTMASTYSHDAQGQRVDQYALPVEPQSNERADFVRSGFRSSRSSLQTGFSADHYHVTEQWGNPVQPYGQWRYPNRPFSVPYGQWGPQLPQVVGGGFGVGLPYQPSWNGPLPLNGPVQMNFGVNSQTPAADVGTAVGTNALNANSLNANVQNYPNGINMGAFGQSGANSTFGNQRGMGFGVGPWNTLPASQDEYYQQAPSLRGDNVGPPTGFFQLPNNQ